MNSLFATKFPCFVTIESNGLATSIQCQDGSLALLVSCQPPNVQLESQLSLDDPPSLVQFAALRGLGKLAFSVEEGKTVVISTADFLRACSQDASLN